MAERKLKGGLEPLREYPLSDDDIRQILGNDIKILTYPELADLSSIDECFDKRGRCILLFLTQSETAGHWCCLMRKRKGIVFFDPYGDEPEEQLESAPPHLLERLNQDKPHLTRLLKQSGKPVFFNSFPYQKLKAGVNSCGRHCVVRLLYAPYSEEQYKKIIDQSGLAPDDFVSALTANWLKK